MSGENKITFILEAGVNHEGDFANAIELVREAAKTGADFIKFQTYTAGKLAAKNSPSYWSLKEESTTSQIELFSKYDGFTKENYFELAYEANRVGIGFMTTCFDTDWVDELDEILPQYKVASADLTNYSLLSHIAKKNKKMLLSTGASTIKEVHHAVRMIRSISKVPISILHCVLNYPTPAQNAALARIKDLAANFPDCEIGFSDHTKPEDSAQAIQIAYHFGARVFEKHFTITPEMAGNDHYHSFTPQDVYSILGMFKKNLILSDYDELTFISNQKDARSFARRGLYYASALKAGDEIKENSIIPLRPSTGEGGFGGEDFFRIIGKRLTRDVQVQEAILESDLS
jgi:N-acetylneuraminate synthase